MARLIRMDDTGHTTLAEWTTADDAAVSAAARAFRAQLDDGYYAVVTHGEGHAGQGDELPLDAQLVVLRRATAGGGAGARGRSWPRSPGARAPTRSGCAAAGACGR